MVKYNVLAFFSFATGERIGRIIQVNGEIKSQLLNKTNYGKPYSTTYGKLEHEISYRQSRGWVVDLTEHGKVVIRD